MATTGHSLRSNRRAPSSLTTAEVAVAPQVKDKKEKKKREKVPLPTSFSLKVTKKRKNEPSASVEEEEELVLPETKKKEREVWFNFHDKTYKIHTYATVGAGLSNDIDDKLKDKGFVRFDFDLVLPEVLCHHKDFSDPQKPLDP